WDPRLIFPVLARVSEEWNHRSDPVRARAPGCIHHDEQLHQMLVSRRTGRLNDENVVASDVFLDPYIGLAVGKRADRRPTQRHTHVFANALSQVAISRA